MKNKLFSLTAVIYLFFLLFFVNQYSFDKQDNNHFILHKSPHKTEPNKKTIAKKTLPNKIFENELKNIKPTKNNVATVINYQEIVIGYGEEFKKILAPIAIYGGNDRAVFHTLVAANGRGVKVFKNIMPLRELHKPDFDYKGETPNQYPTDHKYSHFLFTKFGMSVYGYTAPNISTDVLLWGYEFNRDALNEGLNELELQHSQQMTHSKDCITDISSLAIQFCTFHAEDENEKNSTDIMYKLNLSNYVGGWSRDRYYPIVTATIRRGQNESLPVVIWDGYYELTQNNHIRNLRTNFTEKYGYEPKSSLCSNEESLGFTEQTRTLISENGEHFLGIDYLRNALVMHSKNNFVDVDALTDIHKVSPTIEMDLGETKNYYKVYPNDMAEIEVKDADNNIIKTFGYDCLSPEPAETHCMLAKDDGTLQLKSKNNHLVWYNEKNTVRCNFPTTGKNSLAVGQRLIQFNKKPAANEVNYLLSEDGTKLSIKDGNQLKVIDKSSFNGNYKTSPTIQVFNF
jgi:hypothetical protein